MTIGEVVVKASTNTDRPVNSMATISARTFSVEEAIRNADGIDDPARLAAGFAGVATTQTTNNAIAELEVIGFKESGRFTYREVVRV
jgi:hypothetical protein